MRWVSAERRIPLAALSPDDTDAASAGRLARFSSVYEAWEFGG